MESTGAIDICRNPEVGTGFVMWLAFLRISRNPCGMATKRAAKKSGMSDEHKAALNVGRVEGRAVRNYLAALDQNRPKRGRKRTADSVEKRLAAVDAEIESASDVARLELVQERMNLQAELASMQARADLSEYEAAFVEHARSYSERKGISYAAWREVGVEPAVLKKAGISRSM
jgi:hypothetical protein